MSSGTSPLQIESNDSPGFQSNTSTTLAWEPPIIKGAGGRRLWHVVDSEEVLTVCKAQLKVHLEIKSY